MEGVPPTYDGAEDRRWLPRRMLRAWPALLRWQRICLWSVLLTGRALRALDAQIASAHDLPALYAADVAAMT
jgi:hypothetical protein